VKHDIDFMSERGRALMITELIGITDRFQRIDGLLEKSITIPLWRRLGITQDVMQRELSKMKDEARRQTNPA